ncbi:MAG TPA: 2,3-bisphosphoglycerate-dependent phosphoglycerate mutase [Puia sp.]|jgi:2,3-bisphosphoglycerate-dependent phosphoglycerate mutase|nr:2,3-bisphosphoglycerate-dependent phosphoglycerate mutase [Puia sp.]
MPLLVLVRHGQSEWNLQNRFTGETDVELTAKGRMEAWSAGDKLSGLNFAHAFTSLLVRAIETLELILSRTGQTDCPISRDRALNERNYGRLQGLNKADVTRQYGEEQVALWRRSFSARPPGGESLEDTAARVIPYFKQMIEPMLRQGRDILVVAHGNSLRSLVMYLEGVSEVAIVAVDLPTGIPRLYTLDDRLNIQKVESLC